MKRMTILVAVLSIVFSISVAAQEHHEVDAGTIVERPMHQNMGSGMMGGMGAMMCPMHQMMQEEWELYLQHKNALGLTADQVAELQNIRIEYLRETIDTRGEHEIAVQELEDLMAADELNVNVISRKISDVHDYLEDIEIAQVGAAAEARDVLTAGQLKQAATIRQRSMRGMMDMMGSMMQDGEDTMHNGH